MHLDTVILVGGGNMGRALAEGWLSHQLAPAAIRVVEPAAGARGRLSSALRCVSTPDAIDAAAVSAVVFAVKPQQLPAVVPHYLRFKGPGTVFISIAAGYALARLGEQLGGDAAVVRAMPNTPAAIGQGITVLCANAAASDAQREVAALLLGSVGAVAWIDDEGLMDAVTALSGSGPAYVFLVIECLSAAGAAAGLPADLAARLARATVAGAGQLAAASDLSAAELRQQVTSPGGTTEAALAVLLQDAQLERLFRRAVAAAKARSEALGRGTA